MTTADQPDAPGLSLREILDRHLQRDCSLVLEADLAALIQRERRDAKREERERCAKWLESEAPDLKELLDAELPYATAPGGERKLYDALMAWGSAERRKTIERCAKATCADCNSGALYEEGTRLHRWPDGNSTYPPGFWRRCNATEIRALPDDEEPAP